MSRQDLLSPELIARIKPLAIRARVLAEEVLTGMHRSPHHGSSIEFAEHKEYTPGDDIRHLDWRALARFDRLYIKKYEDETNLKVHIVLDVSSSMQYKSEPAAVSKFEYAKTLAAALMFLLYQQQDSAGLVMFSDSSVVKMPPRSSQALIKDGFIALESAQSAGKSDFYSSFFQLERIIGTRSMVIVISDLLDITEDAMKILEQIRQRKNDVVLFHLLDRFEVEFPFDDLTQFESMEDDRTIMAEPNAIRQAYLQEIRAFVEGIRNQCLRAGIDYNFGITDWPYDRVLLPFLRRRSSR